MYINITGLPKCPIMDDFSFSNVKISFFSLSYMILNSISHVLRVRTLEVMLHGDNGMDISLFSVVLKTEQLIKRSRQ